MQNLSILQLLKTLSAVNAFSSTPESEENATSPAAAKKENCPSPPPKPTCSPNEEKKQTEHSVSPTHARAEEEKTVSAYENFLSRHEQAVKRVKNKADRD